MLILKKIKHKPHSPAKNTHNSLLAFCDFPTFFCITFRGGKYAFRVSGPFVARKKATTPSIKQNLAAVFLQRALLRRNSANLSQVAATCVFYKTTVWTNKHVWEQIKYIVDISY